MVLYQAVCKSEGHQVTQFPNLNQHDTETANEIEDLHSTQLKKAFCKRYLEVRLLSHGQKYYKEVIQRANIGRRQHLTKTMMFQNL